MMLKTNELDQRLSRKINLFELASLLIVFLIAVYFLVTKSGIYYDFENYLATAQGDFNNYFYGYWLVPFFKILAFLPFEISYFIWIVLSIIGVFFATRVFIGNSYLALFSYQMSFLLFWGQISGIITGFLGLFWWSMHQQKWRLAGIALLIATAKPQSGGIFALLLWIFADIPWKDKFRLLIIPIIGFVLSLIAYPGWIMDVLSRSGNAYAWGNISLYQWIGWWALLLFIPAIIIPMSKQQRFLILVSTCILTIPYFLQTDLITLFVFPVGFIPILIGYLPAIMPFYLGYQGQHVGFLVPFFVYFYILVPELVNLGHSVKNKNTTTNFMMD